MFTGRRSDGRRDQGQRPGVPVDDECLLAAGLTEDEIKANALVILFMTTVFTGRRYDGGRDQGQRPGVPVYDDSVYWPQV